LPVKLLAEIDVGPVIVSGKDKVTPPVELETTIWFVVPEIELTPDELVK
jgi:hypothetical protein